MTRGGADWIELELDDAHALLHDGDGLCYFDLQKELVGVAINRAKPGGNLGAWRVWPKDPIAGMRDLR